MLPARHPSLVTSMRAPGRRYAEPRTPTTVANVLDVRYLALNLLFEMPEHW